MIPTSQYLAGRLREVFLTGKWIANTNYQEQLQGLTLADATATFYGLNSIAAITYHINYYLAGLLRAFESGVLDIHDKESFDMPALTNEDDWQRLRHDCLSHAAEFALVVQGIKDEDLAKPFVQEQYGSNLRNIEAVIEHAYYHLGQIVLIIKMLQAQDGKP